MGKTIHIRSAKKAAKPVAKSAAALPPKDEVIDTPPSDDVIDTPPTDDVIDTPPADDISDEILSMLADYKRAYPKEKAFIVTSDNQVFLSANESDAKAHEKLTLKSGKEPVKYEVI